LAQLRGDYILVVIRISIWIYDMIEGFFTIASCGKRAPNKVLPRCHLAKTTEAIDIALAEVCALRVTF